MQNLIRPGGSAAAAILMLLASVAPAWAQQAKINALSDIAFGDLGNTSVDVSQAQNLCVYASNNNYTIKATGSGAGGAFALRSGTSNLPYEVQWGFASGLTSGTKLSPGVALGGRSSGSPNIFCYFNSGSSASLIVTLRAANFSVASAGNYSGTLTLLVSPN